MEKRTDLVERLIAVGILAIGCFTGKGLLVFVGLLYFVMKM